MSSTPRQKNSKIYKETWKKFGKNLENYIELHKNHLEDESYDVILGFSRGGTILAHAFACLLKDSGISEYSDLTKASVRSIPGRMTVKKSDPCFVMDLPASRQEKEDIITYLKKDLEDFSKEHKDGGPLRVLIMDDNLTGATRVKYLQTFLKSMKMKSLVKKCNTLAYVRHKAFLDNEIFTIRKFPRGKEIFVMPWHKPHEKRELRQKHIDTDSTRLMFRIGLNSSLSEFKEYIKKYYGIRQDFILNGASNFFINYARVEDSSFIDLCHFSNMFYPPKECLALDYNAFEHINKRFRPLCNYGVDEKAYGTCIACSCLNCNKILIWRAIRAAKNGTTVSIRVDFDTKKCPECDSDTLIKLVNGIKRWFGESLPRVGIKDL